ncbi:MAG: TetR/AcrR family transcriptional regulator [Deltaproteobacteria bacterium]|nr:TetR/AcrR family transcriptional regulator [Deltaproteobacteria bacterium]
MGDKSLSENDKKQVIIKAAQEIISEKGLKNSTITEIAKLAGVVDSIIYHYFKNKEDLLFCAVDEQMKNSFNELMFQFKGILGPVSKLGKMVWYHLYSNDFSTGNALIQKNLLLECRSNKNFYQHSSYNSLKKYTRVMLEILKTGVEERFFRDDLDMVVVRDMIFGLLDEESLACLSTGEVSETLPDFKPIMALILSMIKRDTDEIEIEESNNKASRVLTAAVNVFAQKGFNKATMVEVANRADVAEGTIYEYFKNKQDLLFSIPKEQFKAFHILLERSLTSENPLSRLRRMIWNHFCVFLSNPDFLIVFLNDIKLNKQFYTSESYSHFLQYIKVLYEILDEGKAQGVFRSDVDNRIYRNLFLGSFTHLAIRWFLLGNLTPLKVMNEFTHATGLLCRAAATKESYDAEFKTA